MFTKAIVRRPGKNFSEGITTASLGKPDIREALDQHNAYCEALARCGVDVIVLEADERYPDGCFVEDTAIVTAEVAVITRPGAESRRGEEIEISRILAQFRALESIEPPGTLDGGDILRVDNHFFIGISGRTSRAGAAQLSAILSRHDYTSSEKSVSSGLHLKSGMAYPGNGIFISVPDLAEIAGSSEIIILNEKESYAANCLCVNDHLLIASGFPLSGKRLSEMEFNIIELDMSEFRKMDGGLTCLSLLL